eukprot:3326606-Rhodomonas_salina.2
MRKAKAMQRQKQWELRKQCKSESYAKAKAMGKLKAMGRQSQWEVRKLTCVLMKFLLQRSNSS